MNPIPPVQNTTVIRTADLVRVTVGPTQIYRFATTSIPITIPSIDASPFTAVGSLISIGSAQRDIKNTANETSISLVGIDTATLGWVLSQNIKGSKVECWHIFFDTAGNLLPANTAYRFFTGYINNFSISEQWLEPARSFVGTINISAANITLILQNRIAGRFTNDSSWKTTINSDSTDNSMARVAFVQTINYQFGKTA